MILETLQTPTVATTRLPMDAHYQRVVALESL